jgi:hypothetical protein
MVHKQAWSIKNYRYVGDVSLDLSQVSFFYIHQVLSFSLASNFQQQGADLGGPESGPDRNVFS